MLSPSGSASPAPSPGSSLIREPRRGERAVRSYVERIGLAVDGRQMCRCMYPCEPRSMSGWYGRDVDRTRVVAACLMTLACEPPYHGSLCATDLTYCEPPPPASAPTDRKDYLAAVARVRISTTVTVEGCEYLGDFVSNGSDRPTGTQRSDVTFLAAEAGATDVLLDFASRDKVVGKGYRCRGSAYADAAAVVAWASAGPERPSVHVARFGADLALIEHDALDALPTGAVAVAARPPDTSLPSRRPTACTCSPSMSGPTREGLSGGSPTLSVRPLPPARPAEPPLEDRCSRGGAPASPCSGCVTLRPPSSSLPSLKIPADAFLAITGLD